ncbi:MAG: putative rane protein [Acidimicrobiales bacterium]|nr:putative rane protein [Acidimicrobiales bacterium]
MTFNSLLVAALRFQRRHILGRTVAVAAGLVMLVAVLEMQAALDRGVATPPGDLGPGTAVVVRGAAAFADFGAVQRPGVADADVATIASAGGVTAAEGADQGRVGLIEGDRRIGVELGTWYETDGLRPVTTIFGAPPDANSVAVTTDLADDLDLAVGDPVTLVAQVRTLVKVGAIVAPRPGRSGAPDVFATGALANRLVGTPGEVGLVVVAGDGGEEAVASAVYLSHPTLETLTRTNFDRERTNDEHNRAVGTRRLLTLFAGAALVVTALIVVAGTAAAVVRRTPELATLRTAGATPRQLRSLVLAEAATVGLVGGALAGPLGTAVALALQDRAGGLGLTTPEAGPRLDITILALAVALGVVLGLVGAILPARRAGRLSVRAALGDLAEPTRRLIGRSSIIGAAVVAAGLVVSGTTSRVDTDLGRAALASILLVVGSCILASALVGVVTGLLADVVPARRFPVLRLALGNLARAPARTAGTAVSVLVGVGLVMLATMFTSSFQANVSTTVDRLYDADAVIVGRSGTPGVPREGNERLTSTPGTRAASPVRQGAVQLGTRVATAVALDEPGTFLGPAFSATAVAAVEADPEAILVSTDVGLAKGTTVVVTGARGKVEATVAGTFGGRLVNASGSRIQAIVPLGLGDEVFGPGPDQAVLTRQDGPVERSRLHADVAGDPAVEVVSLGAFASRQSSSADRAFALSVALLAMTLITAITGLANTVAASVAERRREMSVLRALGMGVDKLAAMIAVETAVLAALVSLAAMLVAVGTGSLLISSVAPAGTPISIPWGRLGLLAVIATVLCSAAALVPALRATRIPVNEGLVEQ